MKNDLDYKYITVPLSVIKRIYTHPKTGISDIFDVGIYKVSTYEDINECEAIKQFLYCFYRERDSIPKALYCEVSGIIDCDEDYNGFDGHGNFDPEIDIESLAEYIKENNASSLLRDIKELHALRAVKEILNMRFDIPTVLSSAKSIISKLPDNDPLVTIKKEMIFDYYKNQKTAYEKDMFACYLGIRSIIGRKDYTSTTKEMILCRMLGCKSKEHIKDALKTKELKKVYEAYSKRYAMDKLLDNLVKYKFITKIGIKPLRRTYVSTRYDLPELTEAIQKDFTQSSLKDNRKLESQAASEILNLIKQNL